MLTSVCGLFVQAAWRLRQGAEVMLSDMEIFFKQGLQQRCQDSSLTARDLVPPGRFVAARELVSSVVSTSYQPI